MLSFVRRLVRMARPVWVGPCSDDSGVAAIEFALVAPILFALVFGIIAYGIYFCVWIAISEAAGAGARASVGGLDQAERCSLSYAAVVADISAYGPMLNINNATITPGQTCSGTSGPSFQVTVTYNITGFGLNQLAGLIPIPAVTPSATVTVSNGGL